MNISAHSDSVIHHVTCQNYNLQKISLKLEDLFYSTCIAELNSTLRLSTDS